MTDIFDRATEREEQDRELALRAVLSAPRRDIEAEVCDGCNYATKASWGKTCDSYRECLQDVERRERQCKR